LERQKVHKLEHKIVITIERLDWCGWHHFRPKTQTLLQSIHST